MVRYPNAAGGLKLIFWGQIVTIIGGLLSAIPFISFVGRISSIIGLFMNLVGIYFAKRDTLSGYNEAFVLTVINAAANLIVMFLDSTGTLCKLLSLASCIIGLLIIYYICNTTGKLLRNVDDYNTADLGDKVWNLTKICIIVTIVCSLFVIIPLIGMLAVLGLMAAVIVALIANIMYLVFLFKSGTRLSMASLNDNFSNEYVNPYEQYNNNPYNRY